MADVASHLIARRLYPLYTQGVATHTRRYLHDQEDEGQRQEVLKQITVARSYGWRLSEMTGKQGEIDSPNMKAENSDG